MPIFEELKLVTEGRAFTGWESIEITRSLEALCGSFRLEVAARTPRGKFPIPDGAPCELWVGRDLYFSGYVDAVDQRYSAREHVVSVEGRDLAQDMVDCSLVDLDSEFYYVGLLELARTFADPFGVKVRLQEGAEEGDRFARFALQPGETAHEALDRAARMRRFLTTSDARGVVTITRAGDARAAVQIREGQQLKSARFRNDRSGRFHRYVALGQQPGSDLAFGADCAEMRGDAFDPVPRVQRTMALPIEPDIDDETAVEIAIWNANVRAARARTLSVTINGWRQALDKGPVWVPNVLVPIDIPTLGVSGDWLVAGVRLSLTKDEGQITELGLVPPDSYLPKPPEPEIDDLDGGPVSWETNEGGG